jgi:arginine deiminase
MELKHIIHVEDLYDFILGKRFTNNIFTTTNAILTKTQTDALIASIQNALILLPSNELSRARGGSHCMSMPLLRD